MAKEIKNVEPIVVEEEEYYNIFANSDSEEEEFFCFELEEDSENAESFVADVELDKVLEGMGCGRSIGCL